MNNQIKRMVDKFLGWKLPKDFGPDAGISFEPEYNKEYMAQQGKPPMRHEPMGTNLFHAGQAEAMFEYCAGDLIAELATEKEARQKAEEQLEEHDGISKLIDAWIAENGKQIPWAKVVQLTAIIMKMPNEERDRLLCLDYPDYPSLVAEYKQRAESAEQRIKELEARSVPEWLPLTNYGQIKVGDRIMFDLCGNSVKRTVGEILNAGTDIEELIYDRGRNYYIITSMAIEGKGSQKNIRYLPRLAASPKPEGVDK